MVKCPVHGVLAERAEPYGVPCPTRCGVYTLFFSDRAVERPCIICKQQSDKSVHPAPSDDNDHQTLPQVENPLFLEAVESEFEQGYFSALLDQAVEAAVADHSEFSQSVFPLLETTLPETSLLGTSLFETPLLETPLLDISPQQYVPEANLGQTFLPSNAVSGQDFNLESLVGQGVVGNWAWTDAALVPCPTTDPMWGALKPLGDEWTLSTATGDVQSWSDTLVPNSTVSAALPTVPAAAQPWSGSPGVDPTLTTITLTTTLTRTGQPSGRGSSELAWSSGP